MGFVELLVMVVTIQREQSTLIQNTLEHSQINRIPSAHFGSVMLSQFHSLWEENGKYPLSWPSALTVSWFVLFPHPTTTFQIFFASNFSL